MFLAFLSVIGLKSRILYFDKRIYASVFCFVPFKISNQKEFVYYKLFYFILQNKSVVTYKEGIVSLKCFRNCK